MAEFWHVTVSPSALRPGEPEDDLGPYASRRAAEASAGRVRIRLAGQGRRVEVVERPATPRDPRPGR